MDVKRVLMVAAENDALPGAKVGGVGDVVRDLPMALAKNQIHVDVVIPSYGFLARIKHNHLVAQMDVLFSGAVHKVKLFRLGETEGGVTQYILHHDIFYAQGESIYCDDKDAPPFFSDATKFAFFCACVAEALEYGALHRPDIVHCHDWHAAFLLILKRFSVRFSVLQSLRTVFTIHNLAMQGLRPFKGGESSLESWYCDLHYDAQLICDRVFPDCVNPMRAAIILADKVHTVSPTYAREILRPSCHALQVYGGESLEKDLSLRFTQNRLYGILNGCDYSKKSKRKLSKVKFIDLCEENITRWIGLDYFVKSSHWLAQKRLSQWGKSSSPSFVVTSVGRITPQKVTLLQALLPCGLSVLDAILESLEGVGLFILMGSGDTDIEAFFTAMSGKRSNFIFLNGYSDPLAQNIYRYGDLFLMPSSFEPCGISQMLSMRDGQPCLVNEVGGLKDTVNHLKTGFVFSGGSLELQAKALVQTFKDTIKLHHDNPKKWAEIATNAKQARFTWDGIAQEYISVLYA